MSLTMFLKDVWRRPGQMGAVAPSSPQLAGIMCDAVDLHDGQVIAELGGGTGAITAVIRARAPTSPLVTFEVGVDLAAHLRQRFPDVRVSTRFAHEIGTELGEWGHPVVDRVVSGLPWTIFSKEEQDRILSAVTRVMKPDGRLVTFTYRHAQVLPGASSLKELLERHFATVTKTKTAWKNVPPAFAWVCEGPRVS